MPFTRTKQKKPTAARRGFTLFELMLVLSIIVLIGSIVMPALGEILERQKLKGAVNEIRLRWDEARLEAMRTGQTQVFECVPESADFTIKPLVLQSDILTAGVGATVMSGGAMIETQENGMLAAADSTVGEAEQLKDEIVFVTCLVAADMRAYSIAQDAQMGGVMVNDLSTMNVGQQVLFYPDGSTSTAEVQLRSPRGDIRAVQIRGLTGHTRTLEVLNVPSADPE